jgi:VIT1/CCC1 family predicted Fe2+/Mn2+ transporter
MSPALAAPREAHRGDRIGWLRAAVLGANDGIVSTASLLVGVAAAGGSQQAVVMTGVAGLVAGAMSMAAGEYVSVHAQSDTERADLARESAELAANPRAEQDELAAIYVQRGLTPTLADEVARQLMQHDALGAHSRDELGMAAQTSAKPLQAAGASAASFAVGAALPLAVAALSPAQGVLAWVSLTSLAFLAALGVAAARAGGAGAWVSARRVSFWGAAAMLVTAAVGKLFGVVAG